MANRKKETRAGYITGNKYGFAQIGRHFLTYNAFVALPVKARYLLFWLLLNVNYDACTFDIRDKGRGRYVKVYPRQRFYRRGTLAKQTALTMQELRTAETQLINAGFLILTPVIYPTTKGTGQKAAGIIYELTEKAYRWQDTAGDLHIMDEDAADYVEAVGGQQV